MLPYIRSALFIPANNPGMIQTSHLLEADAIIFDLEDAISPSQKDSARILLKEAFSFIDFQDTIKIVRINPMDSPFFFDDIKIVKDLDIHYILLAKADIESVKELEKHLIDTNIKIITLIESTKSLLYLKEILLTSSLIDGVLFGAEDYSLDLKISRSLLGDEIMVARQIIAYTCSALNKFSIDTPFTDTDNEQGLYNDSVVAKRYGMSAKACINPRQVDTVNKVFSPTSKEIHDALEIVMANEEALEKGLGVFSLNGKMVDAPIVNRAKLVLDQARKAGLSYE